MKPIAAFRWKASTRNHHVLYLGDFAVGAVVRPQKHRSDGTKHDWRIEVLGSHSFELTFRQHDPRDLDSTKLAAEARTKWAIECLHRTLRGKP